MTVSGTKSRGLIRELFSRKKSTYGLILPEELEARAQAQIMSRRRRKRVKDCFVPSDLDRWELPQYESLFNHLITQDGSFRRRLSSTASNLSYNKNCNNNRDQDESIEEGAGPLKAVQKWFREIVKSLTHQSGDYDLGGDVAVEGIPVDMCEKLRYVHIYYWVINLVIFYTLS